MDDMDTSMSSASSHSKQAPLNASLDEIIASNKRIADAANRTHYTQPNRSHSRNHRRSPKAGNTPYLGVSRPSAYPSPSARRSSPRRYSNNRRHHPYATPKTPREKRESSSPLVRQTPREKQDSPAGRSWKVYVSNMAPGVSDSILKKHFSKAGKVLDCAVHYDEDGEHKGSAVVEFSTERGVDAAIDKFHGALFYGLPLDVFPLALFPLAQ